MKKKKLLNKRGTGKSSTKISKRSGREATMNKLIKAGTSVFAKWGYDGASTKTVAKKAQVNEALITRYFGGKDGLILAIILNLVKQKKKLEECQLEPLSLKEMMTGILDGMREFCMENRAVMKIAISRAVFDSKMHREIHKYIPISGKPELRAKLEALRAKGEMDPQIDIDTVMMTCQLFDMGNLFMIYMQPPNLDLDKLRAAAKFFIDEIARAVSSKRS